MDANEIKDRAMPQKHGSFILFFMKRTIFIFLFVVFISCEFNINKKNTVEIPCEKIDFNSFFLEEVESIPSHLINSKKYIKIDDSKENFIFRGIDKIKIFKDNIYILDRRMKKLLVFNMEGEGIGMVGKLGQGPDEYLQITDFDVDNKGCVCIIDGVSNKLMIYDSDFQIQKNIELNFEIDIIHCLDNNTFMLGLSAWNVGEFKDDRVVVTDFSNESVSRFLKYDKFIDNSYWISYYTFIESEDFIYYNKPIENELYVFSQHGDLLKKYQFDFGKNNVPNKYKMDIEKNLHKYEKYCCLKNFTVVTEKYIIGTLWEKLETKVFIVDRGNEFVYKLKTSADSDKSGFVGYYEGNIISYIYPGKYDDIYKEDLPEDIKEYINDDNIVICISDLN